MSYNRVNSFSSPSWFDFLVLRPITIRIGPKGSHNFLIEGGSVRTEATRKRPEGNGEVADLAGSAVGGIGGGEESGGEAGSVEERAELIGNTALEGQCRWT